MTKKELVQAIQNNRLAEFISVNYWKMSKEQLKDIAMNLMFTMYDNDITEEKINAKELLSWLGLED